MRWQCLCTVAAISLALYWSVVNPLIHVLKAIRAYKALGDRRLLLRLRGSCGSASEQGSANQIAPTQ